MFDHAAFPRTLLACEYIQANRPTATLQPLSQQVKPTTTSPFYCCLYTIHRPEFVVLKPALEWRRPEIVVAIEARRMYAPLPEEPQASGAWAPSTRQSSRNLFQPSRVVRWRELKGIEHLADGAMCSCYTATLALNGPVVIKKPGKHSHEVRSTTPTVSLPCSKTLLSCEYMRAFFFCFLTPHSRSTSRSGGGGRSNSSR